VVRNTGLALIQGCEHLAALTDGLEGLGALTLVDLQVTTQAGAEYAARQVTASFLTHGGGKIPQVQFGLIWNDVSRVSTSMDLSEVNDIGLSITTADGRVETRLSGQGEVATTILSADVTLSYAIEKAAAGLAFRAEDEVWRRIAGAEVVRERLGWYPSFHDADLLSAQFDPGDGGPSLRLRMRLHEGGPRDEITLHFEEVSIFSVGGWTHDDASYYFTGSELALVENGLELHLSGPQGEWRVRCARIRVADLVHE